MSDEEIDEEQWDCDSEGLEDVIGDWTLSSVCSSPSDHEGEDEDDNEEDMEDDLTEREFLELERLYPTISHPMNP
jgi:hypothetical protein